MNRAFSVAILMSIVSIAVFFGVVSAKAAENGKGMYLLGSKNSMAGAVPPPGFYFTSETYFYSGKAAPSLEIPDAGRIVAGVQADVILEVPIGLWVAPQQVAGGNLGFGVLTPFGHADVSAAAEVTVPGQPPISADIGDSSFTFGDPVLLATLGWSHEQWFWSVYSLLNVPIGDYKNGRLSNLAFNRWALDLGVAVTWFDASSGYELSSTAGFTFNGENDSTNYKTGTEFHVEFAALKHISSAFSFGLAGYHYQQISDDSGTGASLGGFRGRTTALGGVLSLNSTLGGTPVNIKGRVYQEVETKNRLKATTGFVTLAFPL